MSRWRRCSECGGTLGHHFTNCPETPDGPDEGGEGEEDRNAGEPSDNDDVVSDD
jgi:hypothetical protein